MDKQQVANLLKQWVPFAGMDDPEAWNIPGEESIYAGIEVTKRAFEYAIDIFENGSSLKIIEHEEAVQLISEWPEFNGMNDPDAMEVEDYPFLKSCLIAIEFTVDLLKNQ